MKSPRIEIEVLPDMRVKVSWNMQHAEAIGLLELAKANVLEQMRGGGRGQPLSPDSTNPASLISPRVPGLEVRKAA